MSSCKDNCNENLQEMFQDDIRDILLDLDDDGLLFSAAERVCIVYADVVGRKPTLGIPGEKILRKEVMYPAPRVEINTKIFQNGIAISKTGIARLTRIPATDNPNKTYTQKQLESADHFLIDCEKYKITNGGINRNESGMFWELTLQREKGQDLS
jgi:hypothetical protein